MKNITKISIFLILIPILCLSYFIIKRALGSLEFNQGKMNETMSQQGASKKPMIIPKPKQGPSEAKAIINQIAQEVITALASSDMEKLHTYIHPQKGVRFSQYGIVDRKSDLVFSASQINNFFTDKKIYHWGRYDGSGDPIELTPRQYFNRFIHTADFSKAEKVGYNQTLTDNGYPENQFQIYPDAIIVEYYIPGVTYPQDWKSLRIVFEALQGVYYIVGIIHNQWTI